MPNILNPYISASSKEKPMNRYKEKADHVRSKRNENKEDRESLKKNKAKCEEHKSIIKLINKSGSR